MDYRYDQLTYELSKRTMELENLNVKCAELEQSVQDYEKKCKASQKTIIEQFKMIARLKEEKGYLTDCIESCEAKLKKALELLDAEKHKTTINSDYEQLWLSSVNEMERVEAANMSLQAKVTDLEEIKSKLENDLCVTKAHVFKLEQDNTSLQSELEERNEWYKSYQEELETLILYREELAIKSTELELKTPSKLFQQQNCVTPYCCKDNLPCRNAQTKLSVETPKRDSTAPRPVKTLFDELVDIGETNFINAREPASKKLKGQNDDVSEPDESVISVIIKDGVRTEGRVRIVETTSIATQTERVAILATTAVQTGGSDSECMEPDSESEEDSSDSRQEMGLSRPMDFHFNAGDFDFDLFRERGNEVFLSGLRGIETASDEAMPVSDDDKALPHFLATLKTLSEDDIEAKAQQATLILEADADTLLRRMEWLKKRRDLTERNLEREHDEAIAFFQSVKHTCPDCQTQELVTEVRSQLDAMRTSAMAATVAAQACGYVQCEVEISKVVAPLLRFIVNASNPRPPPSPRYEFAALEESRDDERVLRRRSVAAVPLSLESRRRASIPFLPTPLPSPVARNGTSSLPPLSPGPEIVRRESVVIRPRREPRLQEPTMEEIEECPSETVAAIPPEKPCLACCAHRPSFSTAPMRPRPIHNALRHLLQYHMDYIQLAQFRWPTSPTEILPFVVTWYLVICCVIVFSLGATVGSMRCTTAVS